jgi:hypothetical protein
LVGNAAVVAPLPSLKDGGTLSIPELESGALETPGLGGAVGVIYPPFEVPVSVVKDAALAMLLIVTGSTFSCIMPELGLRKNKESRSHMQGDVTAEHAK